MSCPDERFGCDHGAEAAPYVLGALDADDAASYADHLDDCASCRAEVALLQETVDALPLSAVPVRASRAALARVMAVVREEAEIMRAAGPEADLPPRRRAKRRRWRMAVAGLASAAAAAAAIAAGIVTTGAPSQRVVAASVTAAGARAELRETGSHGQLVVAGMPQPPPGKVYEVWLARPGGAVRPTDALFDVSARGSAAINVPGSLRGVQRVMVTAEPRGGSEHPTSAPVIVATLSSS